MASEKNGSMFRNPSDVIKVGAVFAPLSLVFLALLQSLKPENLPSNTYLGFGFASAFFCSLATCIIAHSYVAPENRRSAVSIQIAMALLVIWGSFICCCLYSNPLSLLVSQIRLPEGPRSGWVVENRDGVEWLVSASHSKPTQPPNQNAFLAVFISIILAMYFAPWVAKKTMAVTRFRMLVSMMCVSWLVAGVAWNQNPPNETEASDEISEIQSEREGPTGRIGDFEKEELNKTEGRSTKWHFRKLSSVALAVMFAIAVYLSVPFFRLFAATFMDTSRVAKLWMTSAVTSLLSIIVMAAMGSRLVSEEAYLLAYTGLALSLFSAWVILPVIQDSREHWVSAHINSLTWSIAGFIFLGRPWRMTNDDLFRAISILSVSVTFQLLHLLLGLYQPRILRTCKSVCWAVLFGMAIVAVSLIYLDKASMLSHFAPAKRVILLILLIGPYAEKPPEFAFLAHSVGRKLSPQRLFDRLRALVRAGSAPTSSAEQVLLPRFYETRDPDIQASLPGSDAVRFIIRRQLPGWCDAVICIFVMLAMIAVAVVVSTLQFSSPDRLQSVRNDIGWYAATLGLCLTAGWLLLNRHYHNRQALVLANENVGWWAGSEFEWMIPYRAIREVRVYTQRLSIETNDGNRSTTLQLSFSGAQASASFIQSKYISDAIRLALEKLDQQAPVDFGPLRITPSGLTVRKRTVHWRHIESIQLTADGVTISREGGLKHWASVSSRHLSNPMCLKMLVFYFYGMRKFLMEVTGVDDVSPSDFERVCRSVEGLDEFGLLDEQKLTSAVLAVFSYQIPHSLTLGASETTFSGEKSFDQFAASEAWRALLKRLAFYIRLPEPLGKLLQPTEDFWTRVLSAFVEYEVKRQATTC
jgi:hypothetical protein